MSNPVTVKLTAWLTPAWQTYQDPAPATDVQRVERLIYTDPANDMSMYWKKVGTAIITVDFLPEETSHA